MKIIALEGIDNAGKTTICKKIEEVFKDRDDLVVSYELSSEIGKSHKKDLSLMDAKEKTLLFATDRIFREKEYKKYKVVVCDRYIYSAFVYREMEGCDIEWVKSVNSIFDEPYLNIYCDVDLDEAFKRGGYIPYTRDELKICKDIYSRYIDDKKMINYKGFEWLVSKIKRLL